MWEGPGEAVSDRVLDPHWSVGRSIVIIRLICPTELRLGEWALLGESSQDTR